MKFCLLLLSCYFLSAQSPNPADLEPDWWQCYEEVGELDLSGFVQQSAGFPDHLRSQANLLVEQLRANVITS